MENFIFYIIDKNRKVENIMNNCILHVIRPGDTLYNLASMYNTTVQEIINMNLALDPYNLRVGQQIIICPHTDENCISNAQVTLSDEMNLAWLEHVLWTRLFLISVADDLGDLEATKTRLLENPRTIANIFRKYYGNNNANTIQNLLTEHLTIGGDLIVALKNNNTALAQELNTKWYQNADEMATAFSRMNPFYSRQELQNMLHEHLRLTTEEVSARLRKDYATDIRAYDRVQAEVLKMSQFFVNGIIRQFPNMF